MDEMKHAKWVFTKKHLWYRDKAGEIDEWRLDYGFHNGPECQICGEAFCEHCHKDCYQSVVIGEILHCTYWRKNTDENGYCHEGG